AHGSGGRDAHAQARREPRRRGQGGSGPALDRARFDKDVGMGGLTSFGRAVLAALGWDRKPPPLDYMLFYRAEVKAVAPDGSTGALQPEDARIPAHQGVPLRTPLPGCTVVVKTGTIVLLGWEKGDPSRHYAAPIFESSGGVTKVVVNADWVVLGGEAG